MRKLEKVITTGQSTGKIPVLPSFLPKANYKCADCEDTGSVFADYYDNFSGKTLTHMSVCKCQREEQEAYILSLMPPLYSTADLADLSPWLNKHPKQGTIIPKIKENPFDSYLFMGDSGVGKTYIAWAIWKNAALSGRRAIATTMAELNVQFRDLEINADAPRPKVLPQDLAQPHVKYTLLLDEIEKMRVTPFSIEKLFELIKNAVDFGHQLVITSNMSEDNLRIFFGEVWGSAIIRRLIEGTIRVQMWRT
jgi:DNA replication protein DnaC